MANVSFSRGIKSSIIQNKNIKDGQLIVSTDTKSLYYDSGSARVKLSEIQEITETERTDPLFVPISNKFYYVTDTSTLWFRNGGWHNISALISTFEERGIMGFAEVTDSTDMSSIPNNTLCFVVD